MVTENFTGEYTISVIILQPEAWALTKIRPCLLTLIRVAASLIIFASHGKKG
jgi:hypothetical protein